MRGRLRQSTINKNYLHSVLNSMTDGVFVTSPDGVIKVANLAACKLLGYGEEELLGRSILAVLEERERAGFDLLQAAKEPRETVVRTRSGQTIPVSFTGSRIDSVDPQFQGNIFVARNITDRKRAERRIRYLARYDALTKIPNRMQFHHLLQQTIARSLRAGQVVAVLYLDMDRFKEVNDTFGHGAGDRTLEVLAERLTRSLPKETVVGRLAGDEFALFVDGLSADADNRGPIAQLAKSLLTEICRPFQLNQQEVFLTASVGIAFCPRDAENVIDLIRNADAAMYYSKQNGGNTFAFYSPEMNAAAVERLMLKSKLRRALERDELEIRYQPKVDLRNGKIIGAEALLRWRLPGHGDIPPSHFIPLAEETNLILDIGEWVLNRVCLDYRQMQSKGGDPRAHHHRDGPQPRHGGDRRGRRVAAAARVPARQRLPLRTGAAVRRALHRRGPARAPRPSGRRQRALWTPAAPRRGRGHSHGLTASLPPGRRCGRRAPPARPAARAP